MLITNIATLTSKSKAVCAIYCVRCDLNSDCFEFGALTALYDYCEKRILLQQINLLQSTKS